MKKIGIITTSNAINFGAVLQAYALKTTLDMLGQKCSVINYAGNESICGRNLYKDDKSIKNIIFNFFIFF